MKERIIRLSPLLAASLLIAYLAGNDPTTSIGASAFAPTGPPLSSGSIHSGATAFRPRHRAASSSTALYVSQLPRNPHTETSENDPDSDPRTDPKSFLTQRSIQSLIHLLVSLNDPHSANWIESFLGTQNQLEYHGTGAGYLKHGDGARFEGGWREILFKMMDEPVHTVRISLGREKFRGGSRGSASARSYLDDLAGDGGGAATSSSASSASSSSASSSSSSTGLPGKKNYSPFGSAPADSTGSADSDNKDKGPFSGGRPKIGFGASYLDSISGPGVVAEDSSNDDVDNDDGPDPTSDATAKKDEAGEDDNRARREESLRRALLEARIRLKRRAEDKAKAGQVGKEEPKQMKEEDEEKKYEQLRRTLLTKRLELARRQEEIAARKKLHRSLLEVRLELERKEREKSKAKEDELRRLIDQLEAKARDEEERAVRDEEEAKEREEARKMQAELLEIQRSLRLEREKREQEEKERKADERRRARREALENEKARSEATGNDSGISNANEGDQDDDDENYMELEVDPLTLTTRLLAVREKIATEFVEDLALIYQADKHLITSLLSRSARRELSDNADQQASPSSSSRSSSSPSPLEEEKDGDDFASSQGSSGDEIDAGDAPPEASSDEVLFEQLQEDMSSGVTPGDVERNATVSVVPSAETATPPPAAPEEAPEVASEVEEQEVFVLERTAVRMHNDKMSITSGSSPFRKGNFDLLYNLSTQASVHRLLRRLQVMSAVDYRNPRTGKSPSREERAYHEANFRWLRDFYVERVSRYFDGDVAYGMADDFTEDMLSQPPAPISSESDELSSSASDAGGGGGRNNDAGRTADTMGRVDPVGLVEEMVRIRSDVVMEWRRAMREVPEEDHGWLRILLLEKKTMGRGGGGGSSGAGGGGGNKDGENKGLIDDGSGGLDEDFRDESGQEGFQ